MKSTTTKIMLVGKPTYEKWWLDFRVSSTFQGIVEITNLETRTKHVTISNVTCFFFFFLGLFLTSMKLLRTFGVILQTFFCVSLETLVFSTFHIPCKQPP